MSHPEAVILVVEDDFVDVEIVNRAVAKRGLQATVLSAADGNAALKILRSDALSPEQRCRTVVFLDINMPGMNGHQFLDELRSDPSLQQTIVFVLTTSDHPRDIARAYQKNVAGYFLKSKLDGLMQATAIYLENALFPSIGLPGPQ
ncbi:MAG: response regulator [Planctomycetales bacterium]|nr:response regulator [Planctomycetales bacterium]